MKRIIDSMETKFSSKKELLEKIYEVVEDAGFQLGAECTDGDTTSIQFYSAEKELEAEIIIEEEKGLYSIEDIDIITDIKALKISDDTLEGFGYNYCDKVGKYVTLEGKIFDKNEVIEEIAINENLCIAEKEDMFISLGGDYSNVEEDITFDKKELVELYDSYCGFN